MKRPSEKKIIRLDPFRVKPFAGQPRKRFRGIKQLADSISAIGQVTPIKVTPCDEKGFDAELVDGERRLQACRSIRVPVEALLEEGVDPAERFALAVAANFCRDGHDCIEVADAIARLQGQGRTYEQTASIFGKTNTFVAQHLALLKLHPDVQNLLKRAGDDQREGRAKRRGRGRMTLSVALLLVPLPPSMQLRAANHIARKKLGMDAARNYVHGLAAAKGKKVGTQRSPRHQLQVLWSQLDAMRHKLERYAMLSHHALRAILAEANDREAQIISGHIDDLCATLDGIGRGLRKRGEK
jgi:ParB/RepB/Spo0J family partition protein